MSGSANHLTQIETAQAGKEQTANELFDAVSPASLFGRRADACEALTWGYYGGTWLVDGVPTTVANGAVSLNSNATNYVEADRAGVVSVNSSAFTPGRMPLYTIVCSTVGVTSYIDHRVAAPGLTGRLVLAMSDADQTATAAQARCGIIEATGALTALRAVVLPLVAQVWAVYANTSGGFGVEFKGASGAGVTVGDGKRAMVYADGANVVRLSADV